MGRFLTAIAFLFLGFINSAVATRTPVEINALNGAAMRGDVTAQFELGLIYTDGDGAPQDLIKAAMWFRKAAEQGHVSACLNLGLMYYLGKGVSTDYAVAANWLRKAAEKGDGTAQAYLGGMYKKGEGVPQDIAKAVAWFRKAATQGVANAQFNLGTMYAKGDGVSQNIPEAEKWFQKAAKQGYPSAQYSLGLMYETGVGVKQSNIEAVKWYRKAADQELPPAQRKLGAMYFNGLGVPQDNVKAYMWLALASAQGDQSAADLLNDLSGSMLPTQIAEAQRLQKAWRPGTSNAAANAATDSNWMEYLIAESGFAVALPSQPQSKLVPVQDGYLRVYEAIGLSSKPSKFSIFVGQPEKGIFEPASIDAFLSGLIKSMVANAESGKLQLTRRVTFRGLPALEYQFHFQNDGQPYAARGVAFMIDGGYMRMSMRHPTADPKAEVNFKRFLDSFRLTPIGYVPAETAFVDARGISFSPPKGWKQEPTQNAAEVARFQHLTRTMKLLASGNRAYTCDNYQAEVQTSGRIKSASLVRLGDQQFKKMLTFEDVPKYNVRLTLAQYCINSRFGAVVLFGAEEESMFPRWAQVFEGAAASVRVFAGDDAQDQTKFEIGHSIGAIWGACEFSKYIAMTYCPGLQLNGDFKKTCKDGVALFVPASIRLEMEAILSSAKFRGQIKKMTDQADQNFAMAKLQPNYSDAVSCKVYEDFFSKTYDQEISKLNSMSTEHTPTGRSP